jgi:phosphoglycolate phosphatase
MKKYDIVAFDLDGTLTDPSHGLIEGFIYAFKKLGINYGGRESLYKYIGPSLFKEWQKDFGMTPDEANEAIFVFREYYNIYGWWDNRVYDGVVEMLEGLRSCGKSIILATSKPDATAKRVMRHFGLDKYFDFMAGADSHVRDEKWKVLRYCLSEFGVNLEDLKEREKCILVGDRKYDAEGALACGIDSLGVLYGHGSYEEMRSSGFTLLAKTPTEVLDLLK